MAALPLTLNALIKAEKEYHGKFGHTIGNTQLIALMSIIDIFYTNYCLSIKNKAPTLPGFQCLKSCMQYLASHLYKYILILYNFYDE